MGEYKSLWILESNSDNYVYGVFSSKVKALESIELWSVGGCHPYDIITDLGKIKCMADHSEFIRIRYHEDGSRVCMYLRHTHLDNGASITSAYRHEKQRGEK